MFSITSKDPSSRARAGVITTPHGEIETPAYVIVGTHAEVKTLTPEDIKKTKTQIIIANTYHLWQRLGNEGLKTYRGVRNNLGWQGPTMTDSGGFQVFSLGARRQHGMGKLITTFSAPSLVPEGIGAASGSGCAPQERANRDAGRAKSGADPNFVRVEDEGVYFKTEKGEQFLGPRESMQIQEKLGADIILAFDECTSPLHDYEYTKKSLRRTHAWEKICLEYHSSHGHSQLLYGIVQGGEFRDLREESAKYMSSLPFHGYAIGGSLGRSRRNAFEILDWTIPFLPKAKPRHFLGIGKIEDLFDGVEAGIDTFDCVIPTREARHGRLWGNKGYFDIIKSIWKDDASRIVEACFCPTCQIMTKKELHECFRAKDKSAARHATIHNVFFFNNCMEQIRVAIQENTLQKLKNNSYIPACGRQA